MADDAGYGDLGCYGATKQQTPNLDSLAKSGIRFTDAHSAATVCTPSRYSLLSGEYSFRRRGGAGILNGADPIAFPEELTTLPQFLQEAGYRTGVVGKWHLGLGIGKTNFNELIKPGPAEVGFDESFIIPATGDRTPCVYVENGRVAGYDPNDPIQVDYQKKIGNEPAGKEKPELLKIEPIQGHLGTVINGVSRIGFMTGGKAARWVDEDMADVLTSKAVSFIESNKSKPFFLYLGTQGVHAPILPHQRFVGTSQAGIRGDAMHELDWTVGEVVATLKKNNLLDNTIVIFTSDNGGVPVDGYYDKRENLNGHEVNGKLRGTKYTLYEGGHRVPFIVSWPKRSPKGRTSSALICAVDLFASVAKLIGSPLAETNAPDSQTVADAMFFGRARGRNQLIHHQGGFKSPLAYREGDFVLVPKGKAWELYDLKKDLEQKNDLASAQPERVERMVKALEEQKLLSKTRIK